jgi:hypothetical protein
MVESHLRLLVFVRIRPFHQSGEFRSSPTPRTPTVGERTDEPHHFVDANLSSLRVALSSLTPPLANCRPVASTPPFLHPAAYIPLSVVPSAYFSLPRQLPRVASRRHMDASRQHQLVSIWFIWKLVLFYWTVTFICQILVKLVKFAELCRKFNIQGRF